MENFRLEDLIHILIGTAVFIALAVAFDYRAEIARFVMSRWASIPTLFPNRTEHGSYAVEQGRERPGTEDAEPVPDLVERLERLDDDQLLDILALLRDADGAYRFAESRVAKFIPGRVEDRLTQVREVRHTEKPAPAGRLLQVRDTAGERVIPFRS